MNTKGFMLSVSTDAYITRELVLYYKTPPMCQADSDHKHTEELAGYKTIKLTQIQLFEDKKYLKGIIFSYLCDGWITEVKYHFPETKLNNNNCCLRYNSSIMDFRDDQQL